MEELGWGMRREGEEGELEERGGGRVRRGKQRANLFGKLKSRSFPE